MVAPWAMGPVSTGETSMGARSGWRAAAVAAGLCLAVAGPAAADRYAATWTGTVRSGADNAGLFGAPGDLTGEAFTAVFTIDARVFDGVTLTQDYGFSSIEGFAPVVPVTADFTLKGVTRHYGATYGSATAADASYQGYDYVGHSAYDFSEQETEGPDGTVSYHLVQNLLLLSAMSTLTDFTDGEFRGPFSALAPDVFMDGSLFEYREDYTDALGLVASYAVQADLSGTSLTIEALGTGEPSPTPEPATWAILLLGFAAVGAAARRRLKPA
jgi:hypothetical protein